VKLCPFAVRSVGSTSFTFRLATFLGLLVAHRNVVKLVAII